MEESAEHWLYRLGGGAWIAAARNEFELGEQALARRAFRPAVTHARRAAGMACNGALVSLADRQQPELRWGRSYMDHLAALPKDAVVPPAVQSAAMTLLSTPPTAPTLVALKPDRRFLDAATIVLDWCQSVASS